MRQLDSVEAVCAQPRNAMTIASGVEDRKVVPLAAVRDQRRFAAELSEFDQSLAARDQSRSRVRLAPRPRILARSYSEACRRLLTASHQPGQSAGHFVRTVGSHAHIACAHLANVLLGRRVIADRDRNCLNV